MFNPQKSGNVRERASSSYTTDRRESDAMDEDEDSRDKGSGDSNSEKDAGEDGRAYIIDS